MIRVTEFNAGDRVRITSGEWTGKTGLVDSVARTFSGAYLIRADHTDFEVLYYGYELEPVRVKTPREVWEDAPEGQAFYTVWASAEEDDAPVVWIKMTNDTKPEDVTNAHVHTLSFKDLARLVPITIHWDKESV